MSRRFLNNCIYSVNRLMINPRGLSFAARRDYLFGIKQMVTELHGGGYQISNIWHLKPRHVHYLVERWQEQGLSIGTIKNRLSQARFVLRAIGKAHLLPALNKDLGVGQRTLISAKNKAIEIDPNRFADPLVRLSVRLQQHFGLRREESIKFIASQADRSDHIILQASWTKGGIERNIPITTPEQRALLDEIKAFVGRGNALIYPDKRL